MKIKHPIPKAKGIDNTRNLIKEGFTFISDRRKSLDSDIFETRLLGKKAICMGGAEAVELFYNKDLFIRKNAVPSAISKSLLGSGVHGMDGPSHRHRKQMFLSMMTPERLEEMKDIALEELEKKVQEWETKPRVVVFEELKEVLVRSGCRWAGVPLSEEDAAKRTEEMGLMVDSFGSVKRLKEGRKARENQEKWLSQIIKDIRKEKINPPEYSAAYIIAHHRDMKGKKLEPSAAAVELNNAVRPLVATAYFLVFGFTALEEHPGVKEKLIEDKDNYSKMFAQEVRRFYPFAPAMAAKVKKTFSWEGYTFKKNTLTVLDFYGTNRHPDSWTNPENFFPERFKEWEGSPFSFVPQGGGNHYAGHRCAGEWLTVMVMRSFFKYFNDNITYFVPEQDLSWSLSRVPAIPESGFVIQEVTRIKDSPFELKKNAQSQTVVKS
ncbi:cytochrome P450 [Alkalicoccus halolimnae]|uniref:Cytochrome P450 n=1 Tax=Alkalicoccus halolimnae TaxID=1667239 RepID=A0A5C7FFE5_9BACI|nr:cytochrome P450 [Alkalicoccus halolimnae]TXF83044.1 cytochrome P450 [Alkalicoccus halolimnae]